ncbi:hypothetical protein [Aquimarina sp. 2201CG14-23]|uniref:hypothetical protein n=1 Tax=Aquimarina mycalae TaxID=3040073 RepID=UPI0024781C10|nr:hypothetical protein [Aquimarina sp. 2201CG14-23]MDH7445437.1 hypothetical protein [Aquimarina sp. 2201CG14-23]
MLRNVKILFYIIALLLYTSNYAQKGKEWNTDLLKDNPKILKKIKKDGIKFISSLKNGKIEYFKGQKPPQNTWRYEKLAQYRDSLHSDRFIAYGDLIMPSNKKNSFSYNFFAIANKDKYSYYYFVAIVSFDVTNNLEVKKSTSFLLTEKKSLMSWWNSIFYFYQSGLADKLPEEYVFKICPPPPSNL